MARIFNARLFVIAIFGSILALFLFIRLNANEHQASAASKTLRVQQWVFTGDSADDILDYTQYSQTASPHPNCGSGEQLPCVTNLPDNISDETALQNYLETPGRTNEEILSMSPQKRNP
jgi:hypothetical protein